MFALNEKLSKEDINTIIWAQTDPCLFAPFFTANDGYVFKQENGIYNVSETGINNEGAKKGAELITKFLDEGVSPRGADFSIAEARFAQNKSAMIIAGPWSWANFDRVNMDYGVAPIPTLNREPAKPFVGVWGAMVNNASPNVDVVREYIFEVARYLMEFGIDGWRLDVPYEIDDDDFWREFRTVVKSVKSDAYICGEVWDKAQRWLQGDMFDSTMNYVQTEKTISYFGSDYLNGYGRNHMEPQPLTTAQFIEAMNDNLAAYDAQINQVQFNLLGSHDMARPLWIMSDNKPAMKLCWLFMMTMPGAPCIYYGDEIGMSAGDDPGCREAYPWDMPEKQDQVMRDHVKQVVAVRHQFEALRTGEFQFMSQCSEELVQYQRKNKLDTLHIAINRSEQPMPVNLPEGNVCFGILDDNGCLPAQSGIVIQLSQ